MDIITTNIIVIALFFILTVIIFNIIITKSLFTSILNTGVVSLISALIFIVNDAMDVAFTEAAVGAGVSTALFLVTLQITDSYKTKKALTYKYKLSLPLKIFVGLIFIALIIIFLDVIAYVPSFGEANNPIHNHVYKAYIGESYNTFKVPNVVTMILGSYRGYDTLGETSVILIAALGVFLILIVGNKIEKNEDLTQGKPEGTILNPKNEFVLTSAYFTLFPLLLLYGFYVQFHGDYGPGGGFQAGVTFATIYILFISIYNKDRANFFIPDGILLKILTSGCLLYLSTGLLTYFLSGSFLDYYYLGNNYDSAYHYGLFIIELGVGLTVFAAMSLIVGQFYSKIRLKEE